jgi:O-antigen biosynthesis protein WbqV
MIRIPKLTSRQVLIVLHDLLATMAAIVVTFLMRFEGAALAERLRGLERFLPFFLLYAAVVYFILGLHRNKWRFTSIPDLYNLFRASTVLAISLLALDYVLVAPNFYGTFFFGKVTILLYWFLQMFFLGGLRVVGVADVAGDTDTAPVGMIQRAERLVVVVVNVGKVTQLGW